MKIPVANTNLGLDLHSSSPESVNFLREQSSLGGHNFCLGRHKQSFEGVRPRYAPPWRRVWFDHVKAFLVKLSLWKNQINNKNFAHFPYLLNCIDQKTQKYVKLISELRVEFENRFHDFKENASSFEIFSCPFSIAPDDVPENLQMEL